MGRTYHRDQCNECDQASSKTMHLMKGYRVVGFVVRVEYENLWHTIIAQVRVRQETFELKSVVVLGRSALLRLGVSKKKEKGAKRWRKVG